MIHPPPLRDGLPQLPLLVLLLVSSPVCLPAPLDGRTKTPNILFTLADDLGSGDLSCYNPESKVLTLHIDRLAAGGIRFTDAHSPSTVCTPTRYSILTGRMAFRTGNRSIFTGAGGPNKSAELKPFILPDSAADAPGQLHNLAEDPGERQNLYHKHPEIVSKLEARLEQSKAAGRSAPKRMNPNDSDHPKG